MGLMSTLFNVVFVCTTTVTAAIVDFAVDTSFSLPASPFSKYAPYLDNGSDWNLLT